MQIRVTAVTMENTHVGLLPITDEIIHEVGQRDISVVEFFSDHFREHLAGPISKGGVIQFETFDGKFVLFPAARLLEMKFELTS